jgi:hypothetical protein
MALQFTFVEIEDPTKPIFNQDGSFTQYFNHARQQIADWRVWAERNVDILMDMFGPMFETYNASADRKDFRFYLLYGRRREIEADSKRKDRWSSIDASVDGKMFVMTYDRRSSRHTNGETLVVCTYKDRSFYAKPELLFSPLTA